MIEWKEQGMTYTVTASIGVPHYPTVKAVATYLAGPLDAVNTWMSQWGTALQVLGGTVLAICMVLVGIKLGAKTVTGGPAGGGGHPEAVGSIFGLAVAGVLIGAALVIVPILIGVGSAAVHERTGPS